MSEILTDAHHRPITRTERWISIVLRTGVGSSLALIMLGTIVTFVHHPQYVRSNTELQRLTSPGAAFPQTLGDVWHGLLSFHGQSIVSLGLLVLVITPVLRVAISIFAFMEERDYVFALMTTAVLAILLTSFLLGRVAG